MTKVRFLHGTVLTNPGNAGNYRGATMGNFVPLQKIIKGRQQYSFCSANPIRNAMREMAKEMGLPINRTRLNDEDQIAVQFASFPNPELNWDDAIMGWVAAITKKEKEGIEAKEGRKIQLRRESIFQMNIALALSPIQHIARGGVILTQSPDIRNSAWSNSSSSALIEHETSYTAYQYPFSMHLSDFNNKKWLCGLLEIISQLNGVAGNHTRSLYEFCPESVVLRLTNNFCAEYQYCFDDNRNIPKILEKIEHNDFDYKIGERANKEFYIKNLQRLCCR
jgi:CRISPR-associated protein Cst2